MKLPQGGWRPDRYVFVLFCVFMAAAAFGVVTWQETLASATGDTRPSSRLVRAPGGDRQNADDSRTFQTAGSTDWQAPYGGCFSFITQSASQAISDGLACQDQSTGFTRANSFWRSFNVADYGIGPGDQYSISSIDVGINNANATQPTQPVTVNLYTSANFPAGFPGSLTLIGTTTVQVADQTNTLLNVPISATVPAGASQIILEVAVPDGTSAGNVFFAGTNPSGETGPSYISAPACQIPNPVTTAAVGSPTSHWVMNIRGSCTSGPSISGRVTYEHPSVPVKPVPGTMMSGQGLPAVFQGTDLSGYYSLSGFGSGSYTIMPSKANVTAAASNGIFSNDAAQVSRHIVGLTTLTEVQQRAAMVGGQGTISSFDAGLIARWIVGLDSAGNQTGQWKFSPVSRTYGTVARSYTSQDYAALLMGDVTGDWTPPTAMRTAESAARTFVWEKVLVSIPEQRASRGSIFTIPLNIENLMGKAVTSFQFDIRFDPAVISAAKLAADISGTISDGLSVASNSPEPGLLKVVVYGAFPVYGEGNYVGLRFRAHGQPGATTPITVSGFRLNNGMESITTVSGTLTVE